MIEFTIPGQPVGWQRTGGSGKRRFTPPKTRKMEELVGLIARAAGCKEPWPGGVKVRLECVYKRVKRPVHWFPCKPDCDNIEKLIFDGLQGIAFTEDSHIVDWGGTKRYAVGDEEPHVTVTLWFLRKNGVRGPYKKRTYYKEKGGSEDGKIHNGKMS